LDGFKHNELEPELDIYYGGNGMYKIEVFDQNKIIFDESLSDELLKLGCINQGNLFQITVSENDLKQKIESLTKPFLNLSIQILNE
jgi:hypothetical protein